MSNQWVGAAVIAFIFVMGIPWFVRNGAKPQVDTLAQTAAGSAVTRNPSSADNYCVAIRGNGDLAPAHWGSLARVFETYGAPEGMAGASSGSMTTFLWESATQNPTLAKNKFEKGRELALMFKSLEGVTHTLFETRDWSSLIEWVKKAQMVETYNPITELSGQAAIAKHIPGAMKALTDLKNSGIFFGPSVQAVAELVFDPSIAKDRTKQALLQKRINALKQTLTVLGSFDARDEQLFVRNGAIDFRALALRFGALGDYFAQRGASKSASKAHAVFMETCLPVSVGNSWPEIVKAEPRCQELLANSVTSYFDAYEFSPNSRVHDPIGKYAMSLVTTSVVSGSSATKFRAKRNEYLKSLASGVGKDVQVSPTDLRFGYWGREQDLKQVEAELRNPLNPLSQLDKSYRFMKLGEGTWLQALALSPAEPGLSPAMEFSSVGMSADLVSFGGWSDLHPVPVLKAAGCQKVVYVTRRGGDSLFSQGVVKRLLNFEKPSWDFLDSKGPGKDQSAVLNNNGSAEFPDSIWHKLYNLKNPQSSFAGSIAAADAVLCTDWNAFDVKTDFSGLISHSYHSPIFEVAAPAHSPYDKHQAITKADNVKDPKLGFSPYAGCISFE